MWVYQDLVGLGRRLCWRYDGPGRLPCGAYPYGLARGETYWMSVPAKLVNSGRYVSPEEYGGGGYGELRA